MGDETWLRLAVDCGPTRELSVACVGHHTGRLLSLAESWEMHAAAWIWALNVCRRYSHGDLGPHAVLRILERPSDTGWLRCLVVGAVWVVEQSDWLSSLVG